MEAIILAGGLGTRLRAAVPDLPKPLAPVAGRPFIAWLLDQLDAHGFSRVVLSVGYMADKMQAALGHRHGRLALEYCLEAEPLGTGGALRAALAQTQDHVVLALNGDSYAQMDLACVLARAADAPLAMGLMPVPDTTRYGRVETSAGLITGFREKGISGPGLINAGIYALQRNLLEDPALPAKFSFEADFLGPRVAALAPPAIIGAGLFIDIGVPEDFARAQTLFGRA